MILHIFLSWISWIFFGLTMIIRPLNDLLGVTIIRWGMKYRQYLGIIAGVAACSHAVLFVLSLPTPEVFLTNGMWSFKTLFGWGTVAWLAILPPLFTSNRFSQRLLKKNWKNIQRLAYVSFVFAGIHISLTADWYWLGFGPVLLWLILLIWTYWRKKKDK